ncbi:MAG: MotA/TolQ/ExbB proton channel family protein [Oscillospiraceae bacterium]|nr:MotA/TolQ/ExbB proton channel family protein [Oscillospiraceae bacterium]
MSYMSKLGTMPPVGLVVIVAIVSLFVLALLVLFITYARYSRLASLVGNLKRENSFLRFVVNDYADAYKRHGRDVNTPAIIANGVSTKLGGSLLCERFLNNAVSLFVTLGLFGTFLGLSLSVSSLTELLGSNTSEWLNVLDSVGGGLMSALSGMGVAFYTSLVGVACSILLTVLRSIFSVQNAREKMETRLELWLDHDVAPTLPTDAPKDDAELVHQLVLALDRSTDNMNQILTDATDDLKTAINMSRAPIAAMNKTVENFNSGVRDFSEFNYNLRGTVERMDVTVRDLVSSLREITRILERSSRS